MSKKSLVEQKKNTNKRTKIGLKSMHRHLKFYQSFAKNRLIKLTIKIPTYDLNVSNGYLPSRHFQHLISIEIGYAYRFALSSSSKYIISKPPSHPEVYSTHNDNAMNFNSWVMQIFRRGLAAISCSCRYRFLANDFHLCLLSICRNLSLSIIMEILFVSRRQKEVMLWHDKWA